ncbi:MAG: hypothetical protein COT91_00585 [Candidatus Doudnabacteria bacterium CG10_big_fil_rev_8_21_14_0_10_41_10]|uniref:DUF2914 domain-containing protein n=1 Tax=Candidatus Doudnabacteria bacterium CG10_big_fil_rev_8_21_14_0_10_41_10 TaxID=1974551 RepID=A0A2H0VET5_9BACT|nr:MAG: hypothetical protein COT91_00585 [Candidatus Doudnabacteria bacterium CG10_big_fil_rev_8_21_14_0_10_41_10]
MRRVFAFKFHYQKVKEFYAKYERWLMPVTLAFGFLGDYITFVNIQVNTAIIILFIYWVICASAIIFIYAFDAGKLPERFKYVRLFIPLVVQFTFGGMLSNSFIFYWFSGSVWVSWPFILAFVALMISNDALRHHFARPTVQLSVYFFATLSIFSVSLPFIFNSLSPLLFVLSGAITSVYIALFSWLLKKNAGAEKFNGSYLTISVASILLIINLFYFTNLLPPVPLAMREIGVYHSIAKSGGQYILRGERESFLEKIIPGRSIHLRPGQPAYVFSSIYAPKELNTAIVHEWQYYDEQQGKWIVKDRLSFNLIGGRREGFRGYSLKTVLPPGSWRVYIKTQRGQTLGRVKFNVERSDGPVELYEVVR